MPATLHRLLSPCYCQFFDRKAMCFSADNARPHTAAATQHALRGVQQLLWPARMPDVSPIEYLWDMVKWDIVFVQSLPQLLLNFDRCLGQSIAGWHSAPLWPFACENTRLRCRQWVYAVYWCNCLGTPYCDVFHLVWIRYHILLQ